MRGRERAGLDWAGMDWTVLGSTGLDWTGLDGLFAKLDWTGRLQSWAGLAVCKGRRTSTDSIWNLSQAHTCNLKHRYGISSTDSIWNLKHRHGISSTDMESQAHRKKETKKSSRGLYLVITVYNALNRYVCDFIAFRLCRCCEMDIKYGKYVMYGK